MLGNQKEAIKKELTLLFIKKYSCININSIQINTTSSLPYDFNKYELKEIIINDKSMKNSSGSFKAFFQQSQKKQKIYFNYKIDANITLFKAKRNLHNDKILSQKDYEKIEVKLHRLPSKVITCKLPKNLISKNYVIKGTILSLQKLEYKKDILRGSNVKALLRDGMLVLDTDAKLLEDGNVGDVVKIRTEQGKKFRAKIITKYEVIILE